MRKIIQTKERQGEEDMKEVRQLAKKVGQLGDKKRDAQERGGD